MDHKQMPIYCKEWVKIVEEIDLNTFCFLNLSISQSITALAYLMEKRMGSIRITVNIHGGSACIHVKWNGYTAQCVGIYALKE